jgi:hypothetical protein
LAGKRYKTRLVDQPIGKESHMPQHTILESPDRDLDEDWDEQDEEFATDDEELDLDEFDEGLDDDDEI